MNNISLASAKYVDVVALRNVFIVALVAGVGITVLFAVAARSLSAVSSEAPTVANRVVASVCMFAIACAVAVGVWAVLAK